MILIIGLGPMGANIGLRLLERGHRVAGLDLNAERAAQWSSDAQACEQGSDVPAWSSFADVDWDSVDTVLIAVRMADQVAGCVRSMIDFVGDRTLTVFVITTLAVTEAADQLGSLPDAWRGFELPVSGGPEGARTGELTGLLAGPAATDDERALLESIMARVFDLGEYGQPALLKLLNNTLGAYNAQSTARLILLAKTMGVAPRSFLELVNHSSGQSWMSDNFDRFHHQLLSKDVRLLQQDVPTLPEVSLDDPARLNQLIDQARDVLEER